MGKIWYCGKESLFKNLAYPHIIMVSSRSPYDERGQFAKFLWEIRLWSPGLSCLSVPCESPHVVAVGGRGPRGRVGPVQVRGAEAPVSGGAATGNLLGPACIGRPKDEVVRLVSSQYINLAPFVIKKTPNIR